MTCLRSKTVVIRKDRQCWACYRKLPIGTAMNYYVGIYEGDFQTGYTCLACQEIMTISGEDEFAEGYVSELLEKGESPEQFLEKWKSKKVTTSKTEK